MRRRILLVVVMIGLFGSTMPVVAQTRSSTSTQLRELREEVRKLRESQNSIESELRELKLLVQQLKLAQAATPLNFVSTDDDPFIGSSEAKVVMIDFSDYQCPFCATFVRDTKPRLDREYFSTGKVRYVFRDLPLEAIHPQAFKAAEAANCAGDQGKYWEMNARLFQNPRTLGLENLTQYAQSIQLDMTTFSQCLQSGKHAAEIRKDMADAEAARIEGTPNFVIGIVNPKDLKDPRILVLKIITGAHPYTSFKAALDSALAAAEQK